VVAVGDSIIANSPIDCPGCTSFVTKYARRLADASDRPASVRNVAVRGLKTDQLLAHVRNDAARRAAIRASDVVMVSIGTNDGPWRRTDDACDGKVTLDDPTAVVREALAAYDEACAKASAESLRGRWSSILAGIKALRDDRPGVLIVLNRFNDWAGYRSPSVPEAADVERVAPMVIREHNRVLCDVAARQGFHCADLSTRFNGPDGTRRSGNLVVDDFTHPSQAGQDAILELLLDFGFAPLVR
jgi:lysophospholipase L1-like esterase